jgi:hypothetical protein
VYNLLGSDICTSVIPVALWSEATGALRFSMYNFYHRTGLMVNTKGILFSKLQPIVNVPVPAGFCEAVLKIDHIIKGSHLNFTLRYNS